MITLDQARQGGLGRRPVERLVREGHWLRVVDGLYAMRSGELPWLSLAWGGVLLGGEGSRVGGTAAGHLFGMVETPPRTVQLWIPGDRRRVDQDPWTFRREEAGERLRSIGTPPRTTIEDTVLDLCAVHDEAGMVDVVTRAVQSRLTSARQLRRRLSQRTRVRGRRFLETLLADVEEGAQSKLELEYFRNVERAHGLPRGRRQVRAGSSVRDVLYEEWDTIVELDGRRGHQGVGRFRDMARDNVATLSGAATLRFGWHDTVGEPCAEAVMLETVLRGRGWTGHIHACRRCAGWPRWKSAC